MKNFYEHDIPAKFVAIYSDGSGADVFIKQGKQYRSGAMWIDADDLTDMGFLWFFELPDDFEVMV